MNSTAVTDKPEGLVAELRTVIERHWGFKVLRPLQEAAMRSVLAGKDSLLVLPTGGGKSLCYQAPAMVCEGTTIVVSPLISLMKDQVDSLRSVGVPAAALNSSLDAKDSRQIYQDLRDRTVRLLLVSPERLAADGFRQMLVEIGVTRFAVDEAHCISHWGHDFRPEYRQLKTLKKQFPQASLHAFTATATPPVRKDIVEQLGLQSAEVFVGNFDRPNLTYRVIPRIDLYGQVMELIDRHKKEAGIIYCIRRKDVDELSEWLRSNGVAALPYHAGLDANRRKSVQAEFKQERCDLVVATVAFGMGIDRSNVRFVLHTGMPKSIEHYQQEAGRAGRDGLEAECVLLHSAADLMTWKRLIEKSAEESGQSADSPYVKSALKHLSDIDAYCRPLRCRHKSLVEYFGQPYSEAACQACDVCLEDTNSEAVADADLIAKKILSCVARVKESFGVGHVTSVLRGENIESIRKWDHDQLTTFGLLKEHSKNEVRDWIYQLLAQNALQQTSADYPVLQLNELSWQIMRAEKSIKLSRHHRPDKPAKKSRADVISWEGVDRELFEALRDLRREYAEERGVPPYVIFSDATLRELARVRPSSTPALRLVYGIGEKKLAEFGEAFIGVIDEHCGQRGLARDCQGTGDAESPPVKALVTRSKSQEKELAKKLFRQGKSLAEVAQKTGRAASTVRGYLCDYIRDEQPVTVETWVLPDVYDAVSRMIDRLQTSSLKSVYTALGETISYDQISIVLAHKAMAGGE
jgi:ATP-dependent DNA helicase RecQ